MDKHIEYLYQLLGRYTAIGAGDFIASKICRIDHKDSCIFCVSCSKLFIPRLNCKTKLDDDKFAIECLSCTAKYVFNTKDYI